MESRVASARYYRPLREKIQWNVEKAYIAAGVCPIGNLIPPAAQILLSIARRRRYNYGR
jgi:hypothetical protein